MRFYVFFLFLYVRDALKDTIKFRSRAFASPCTLAIVAQLCKILDYDIVQLVYPATEMLDQVLIHSDPRGVFYAVAPSTTVESIYCLYGG